LPNTKKILLIRFSSIGDIVLTSPLTRCLHKQLPNCEIHYLTKAAYEIVLKDNPYLKRVHFLEKPLSKTIKKIKAEQFDLIIDLHKNIRSYCCTLFTKAKIIRFNKLNIEKWLLVNFKVNRLPNKHLVDRYFESVESLEIQNDHKGLDFFINPTNTIGLPFNNTPYIAIAVGAKHYTKTIPIEHLLVIINRLSYPVVLLGDKNDGKTASLIKNQFKNKVANYCGNINLQQSAFLIEHAQAVLCGDTALMHIAAAFNRPIFSVWGNTIPQMGMYPYVFKNEKQVSQAELNMYEQVDLSCRPCSKIGYDVCPQKHFKCMKDISPHDIANDINQLES